MSQFVTELEAKWCEQCSLFYSNEAKLCPVHSVILIKVESVLQPGDLIDDKYSIVSVIGEGSWGSVYRARREDIERDVAIKVLHEHLSMDETAAKRFLREAKALNNLRHPNLTRVFKFGTLQTGQPYFVMDYIEGPSLESLIKQKGYLPAERTIEIFRDVCAALAEIHAAGVVHRDLKPSNIILKEETGKTTPVIVDFGLVTFGSTDSGTTSNLTKTGIVLGTPQYMSPEQCRGFPTDARSDIYSLGCTMYETLSGIPPFFSKDIMQLMAFHLQEPSKEVSIRCDTPEVGEALADCVMQCLSKEPQNRPQSAEELKAILDEAGRGTNIAARRSTPIDVRTQSPSGTDWSAPGALAQSNNRKLILAAALIASMVAVMVVASYALSYFAAKIEQDRIKQELALRPQVNGTLVSITQISPRSYQLHIRTTDGAITKIGATSSFKVRHCVPGQFISVTLDSGSMNVVSMAPVEESRENQDAQLASERIAVLYELMSAREDLADRNVFGNLLSKKLLNKGKDELQRTFNQADVREEIRQPMSVPEGDEAGMSLTYEETPSIFQDPGAVRFVGRRGTNAFVFILNKSCFYKHDRGWSEITLLRSTSHEGWEIDSVRPATSEQWDEL